MLVDQSENRLLGVMAGPSTVHAVVEQVVFLSKLCQLPPLDSEDEIVIRFVDVNYSESVDLGVARVLFNHSSNDLLPSVIGLAVPDGIVE